MVIYHKYANLLLELHKTFHQLVLTEFTDPQNLTKLIPLWETNLRIDLKGKIIYKHYPSQWDNNKIVIRPSIKVYDSLNYGSFFIEYRSYSGKVSKNIYNTTVDNIEYIKNKNKNSIQEMHKQLKGLINPHSGQLWNSKQSIFDFYLDTGERYTKLYNGDATHYNLFEDLKKYSNYINCLYIWRGDEIFNNIKNEDEKDALVTLSWLMFEQEINYGRPAFQQNTNFIYNKEKKLYHRSRDMIMGFLNMLFSDTDLYKSYPNWRFENYKKIFPHFGPEGYKKLDEKYRKYFTEFNNYEKYKDVFPLFEINNYKEQFNGHVKNANQNPFFNFINI